MFFIKFQCILVLFCCCFSNKVGNSIPKHSDFSHFQIFPLNFLFYSYSHLISSFSKKENEIPSLCFLQSYILFFDTFLFITWGFRFFNNILNELYIIKNGSYSEQHVLKFSKKFRRKNNGDDMIKKLIHYYNKWINSAFEREKVNYDINSFIKTIFPLNFLLKEISTSFIQKLTALKRNYFYKFFI